MLLGHQSSRDLRLVTLNLAIKSDAQATRRKTAQLEEDRRPPHNIKTHSNAKIKPEMKPTRKEQDHPGIFRCI